MASVAHALPRHQQRRDRRALARLSPRQSRRTCCSRSTFPRAASRCTSTTGSRSRCSARRRPATAASVCSSPTRNSAGSSARRTCAWSSARAAGRPRPPRPRRSRHPRRHRPHGAPERDTIPHRDRIARPVALDDTAALPSVTRPGELLIRIAAGQTYKASHPGFAATSASTNDLHAVTETLAIPPR